MARAKSTSAAPWQHGIYGDVSGRLTEGHLSGRVSDDERDRLVREVRALAGYNVPEVRRLYRNLSANVRGKRPTETELERLLGVRFHLENLTGKLPPMPRLQAETEARQERAHARWVKRSKADEARRAEAERLAREAREAREAEARRKDDQAMPSKDQPRPGYRYTDAEAEAIMEARRRGPPPKPRGPSVYDSMIRGIEEHAAERAERERRRPAPLLTRVAPKARPDSWAREATRQARSSARAVEAAASRKATRAALATARAMLAQVLRAEGDRVKAQILTLREYVAGRRLATREQIQKLREALRAQVAETRKRQAAERAKLRRARKGTRQLMRELQKLAQKHRGELAALRKVSDRSAAQLRALESARDKRETMLRDTEREILAHDPQLIPLFKAVRHKLRSNKRRSMIEHFMQYAHDHAGEAAALAEKAEASRQKRQAADWAKWARTDEGRRSRIEATLCRRAGEQARKGQLLTLRDSDRRALSAAGLPVALVERCYNDEIQALRGARMDYDDPIPF